MAANCLGLGTLDGTEVSEVDGIVLGGSVGLDDTEAGLVLDYVVLQGVKQPLCVLGGHEDAAYNLRLGKTGKHCCEINDELTVGVGDEGKI